MAKSPAWQRWPAEIVTHIHKRGDTALTLHGKVDFDPVSGKPHGIYLWRADREGMDIDNALDELSRKISRVMQGRYP